MMYPTSTAMQLHMSLVVALPADTETFRLIFHDHLFSFLFTFVPAKNTDCLRRSIAENNNRLINEFRFTWRKVTKLRGHVTRYGKVKSRGGIALCVSIVDTEQLHF